MKYLELTFADPARNLACDEALLELFEMKHIDDGLLRLWQPESYFVVLGHSNRWRAEANVPACVAAGIPILRRVSGGGTVLQGPGCFNYSLLLDGKKHDVKNIQAGFRYVLDRHRQLFADLSSYDVRIDGISDLTVAGRKFSGNAQYRKSRYVLVHGTFLVNFNLSMIDRCLHLPAKQPAYRGNRPHLDFITNLGVDADQIRSGLQKIWLATDTFDATPLDQVEQLLRTRYGQEEWSSKF
ncbi:MAG: lipoate--protein ligase family protein [Candidatus Binatia bacterium]